MAVAKCPMEMAAMARTRLSGWRWILPNPLAASGSNLGGRLTESIERTMSWYRAFDHGEEARDSV